MLLKHMKWGAYCCGIARWSAELPPPVSFADSSTAIVDGLCPRLNSSPIGLPAPTNSPPGCSLYGTASERGTIGKKRVGEMIDYRAYQDELLALRRHFRQWPELSLQEKATSAYVEQYLTDLGLQVRRVGEYGLTAMIWAGASHEKADAVPCVDSSSVRAEARKTATEQDRQSAHLGNLTDHPTVAVRAEIDAIAVLDQVEAPWRSRNDGVCHACGHDANIATVLVLAKICVEHQAELPVNVKLMFQQAEENGEGTALMLNAGLMRDPTVDYFVMIHYANDAPDGMELHKGASSAAIGRMRLTVRSQERRTGASAAQRWLRFRRLHDVEGCFLPPPVPVETGE